MKLIKPMILIAVLVAIGAGLAAYWRHGASHPTTDDSYLQAGILTVTPQVSGVLTRVVVTENALVQAGDVLFEIDNETLTAARDAAQAALDQAMQAANAANSNVIVAQAQVNSAMAAMNEAQTAFDRQSALAKDGNVSKAALDQAQTAFDSAAAGAQAAQAAVEAAKAQSGGDADTNAGVRSARANLTLAEINLGRATVTAPASGWISNIALRPGQFVAAGQPQFSIVEDQNWWVDANFKETDLTLIRAGMPATIRIDMYPDAELTGVVDSIGAGSGASFSLLPAQNATGNWVKVTQRFAVRVHLTDTDLALPLRVGASTTVTIDTTKTAP